MASSPTLERLRAQFGPATWTTSSSTAAGPRPTSAATPTAAYSVGGFCHAMAGKSPTPGGGAASAVAAALGAAAGAMAATYSRGLKNKENAAAATELHTILVAAVSNELAAADADAEVRVLQ